MVGIPPELRAQLAPLFARKIAARREAAAKAAAAEQPAKPARAS